MIKRIATLVLCLLTVVSAISQVKVDISDEKIIENGKKYYLHTTQAGQTLYSICKAYGISEKDVINANIELQSKGLSVGQVVKIPILHELSKNGNYYVHTVKKGETLYSLLKRYETNEAEFYEINSQLNPKQSLRVGSEIYFPIKKQSSAQAKPAEKPQAKPAATPQAKPAVKSERDNANYIYHTVEQGETMYKIRKMYDISQEELIQQNPELSEKPLAIGQVVRIKRKNKASVATRNDNSTNFDENADEGDICNQANWYKGKQEFNVMLLMSFEKDANIRELTSQEKRKVTQKLRYATMRAVDFYGGCLVALENFKNEDVKINFEVLDIGKDNTILTSLTTNGKFANADLIIGPAFKSQADYLNTQNLEVPILLPFVSDEAILKNHSNNILLNSSKQDFRQAIVEYAKQNTKCNALVIKGTTEESQALASKYQSDLQTAGVVNSIVNFNGTSIENISTHLKKDSDNLLILTFDNEMSINRVFTQVFKLCKENNISIIGDQKILSYDNLDPKYYTEVNFCYYTNNKVNYDSEAVKSFVSKFRKAFMNEPNTDAFVAADAINYFIPKLQKMGKNFTLCLDGSETYKGLGGEQKFVNNTGYSQQSFSNNVVYINMIDKDFTTKQVFPQVANVKPAQKKK